MSLWITMIAAGLLTVAIRLSFMFLWGRLSVPDWLQRALRFVPPAVLTAIIFPEIFVREGQVVLSPANPRLIAGVIAAVVGWRTKNIVWTIAAGMLALWLVQALPFSGL